jgi:hypothetical protein
MRFFVRQEKVSADLVRGRIEAAFESESPLPGAPQFRSFSDAWHAPMLGDIGELYDSDDESDDSPSDVIDGFQIFTPPLTPKDKTDAQIDEQADDPDSITSDRIGAEAHGYMPLDDAEITRRACRKSIRVDPQLFSHLSKEDARRADRIPFPFNRDLVEDQAAGWLLAPVSDSLKTARDETLKWLRAVASAKSSGRHLSERAYCGATGIAPSTLRHRIKTFCESVAERLDSNPPLPAVDALYVNPKLAIGIDAIARELWRTVEETRQMIDDDKLPTGLMCGEVCADRKTLRPLRPTRKPVGVVNPTGIMKAAKAFAAGKIDRARLMKTITPAEITARTKAKPALKVIKGGKAAERCATSHSEPASLAA